MASPETDKDIDILETRGLWQASSFVKGVAHELLREKRPLRIEHIRQAHEIIFKIAGQATIAGRYRGPGEIKNPKRIDGSTLVLPKAEQVPELMWQLDLAVKEESAHLRHPQTQEEYLKLIETAAHLSHRLTEIHPFPNGNGRASRLLIDALLQRADLPEAIMDIDKIDYRRAMMECDKGNMEKLENMITAGLVAAEEKLLQARSEKQKQEGQGRLGMRRRFTDLDR